MAMVFPAALPFTSKFAPESTQRCATAPPSARSRRCRGQPLRGDAATGCTGGTEIDPIGQQLLWEKCGAYIGEGIAKWTPGYSETLSWPPLSPKMRKQPALHRSEEGSPGAGESGCSDRMPLAALSPTQRKQRMLMSWNEYVDDGAIHRQIGTPSTAEPSSPPPRPASAWQVRKVAARPFSLSAPSVSEELTVSDYKSVETPRSVSSRAPSDIDWKLRQEVKQLKTELNLTVAELMDAKAELALLRPNGTDSLRRAKEFLAIQSVANTAANGNMPLRFVPLCGAKELVLGKQQAPQQNALRSSPKGHIEEDAERERSSAQLKRKVALLEEQLIGERAKFERLQAVFIEKDSQYEQLSEECTEMETKYEQLQAERERLVDLARCVFNLCRKRKMPGTPARKSLSYEDPEKLFRDCIASLEERNFQDEQAMRGQIDDNPEGESRHDVAERCSKKAKFDFEDESDPQPRSTYATVACQFPDDDDVLQSNQARQDRIKQLWQFAAAAVRRLNSIKLQRMRPVWRFAAVVLEDTFQRLAYDVQAIGTKCFAKAQVGSLSFWEFAARHVRDEEFAARTRLLRDTIDGGASWNRRSDGSTWGSISRRDSTSPRDSISRRDSASRRDSTSRRGSASRRHSTQYCQQEFARMQAGEQLVNDSQAKAFEAAGGPELVHQCCQRVSHLIRRMREARPVGRVCQDVGYTTLGLDNLFDMCACRRDKLANEVCRIAAKTHGECWVPDLKDRVRARSKILTKLNDDTACLTDILRASICYEGIRHLYDSLCIILEEDLKSSRRDFFIREVDDHFHRGIRNRVEDNYRNIVLLFDIDGVICEVQLHCKSILKTVKSGGVHETHNNARQVHELLFEACVRNNEHELVSLARCFQTSASGVRDRYSRTALHYACQHGSPVTVRYLMKFGADPWVVDRDGILPCELALRAKHLDALALVLAQMCKSSPSDARVVRRLAEHSMLWWCDHTAHAQAGMTQLENDVADNSMRRRDSGVDMEAPIHAQASPEAPRTSVHEEGSPQPAEASIPTQVRKSVDSKWAYAGRLLWRVLQHVSKQNPELCGEHILDRWLSSAASAGESRRVLALLSTGFDMTKESGRASAMDCAIEGGHVELADKLRIVHLLNKSELCVCWLRHVNEHLWEASKEEDGSRALAALKARADPNDIKSKGPGKRTPLMAFAAAGDLAITKQLIISHAHVGHQDAFGSWAVHYAQTFRHVDVEELLLCSKHPPDVPMHKFLQTSKWTRAKDYMVEAVRAGCCAAIWRLTTDEATAEALQQDLNEPTGTHSYTLLHIAVQAVRETDPAGQVCRSLLMLHADGTAKAKHGETPLHLLAYEGSTSLYNQMLLAIRAQEPEDDEGELDDKLTGGDDDLLAQNPHELLRRKMTQKEVQAREQYATARGSQKETDEDGRLFLEAGLLGLKHNLLASLVQARREEQAKSRHAEFRENKASILVELGAKMPPTNCNDILAAADNSSESGSGEAFSDVSEDAKVEVVGRKSRVVTGDIKVSPRNTCRKGLSLQKATTDRRISNTDKMKDFNLKKARRSSRFKRDTVSIQI